MLKLSRSVRLVGVLTIIFCFLFVTDAFPWLRGDVSWIPLLGRWRWPYGSPRGAWLVPCVAGVSVYVWGARRLLRRAAAPTRRDTRRVMLWAYGGAVLLPLLLLTLEGGPLYLLSTRSLSPITGGYPYASAMLDDTEAGFGDWLAFVDVYRDEVNINPPGGVTLSPPGLVMLFRAQSDLVAASPPVADTFGAPVRLMQCQNLALMTWDNEEFSGVWLQIFMPFWAALAIVPLYRLGVLLFDRDRARLAVLLWPLIPGLAIFQPRFNVLYPLLAALVMWWLWQGMLRRRVMLLVASGAVLSCATFFNLSLVPLGLVAGLMVLGYRVFSPDADVRRMAGELAAFGVGCFSVWGAYWVWTGQTPWALADFLVNQHYVMYRPYLPWLIMHPYDMFLFVGLPVTALALWRVARLRGVRWGARTTGRGDIFALASIVGVAILVFSGTARGETGRVWLFFAPLWVLLAADMLARFNQREQVVVVALQAIVLISMAAVLRANFTGFTRPPQPDPPAQPPAFPTYATFEHEDDAVTLVGLSVESTSDRVTLHLHWQADRQITRPYVLSLISIGPDGTPHDTLTWNPLGWEYPPSCWASGREFVDSVQVVLGDGALPGDWLFSLSVHRAFSDTMMQVAGTDQTQYGIGPVTVPVDE